MARQTKLAFLSGGEESEIAFFQPADCWYLASGEGVPVFSLC